LTRASKSFVATILTLTVWGQALAALPPRPAPLSTPRLPISVTALGAQKLDTLLWTPLAEVRVGRDIDASQLFGLDGTYGASYVLTAPVDGVVEYLYPWTGFFQIGQPLLRVYDP